MHDQQEFIKDLTQLSSKIPTRSNGAEFKCFLRIDRWFCQPKRPKMDENGFWGSKYEAVDGSLYFIDPFVLIIIASYINLLVLTGYKWGYILIP